MRGYVFGTGVTTIGVSNEKMWDVDARAKNNVKIVGRDGGPTIVLAHGFGCDQNLWRLVTERLVADYRVVLFDHVGAGASDPSAWDADRYSTLDAYAEDVLALVEGLDLRDVVFVGHSVASMIGVLAVAADPSRFAKLVLLTPSPRYVDDESDGYRGGFTRADIDELLESLEANYLGWSQTMAPNIMGNPDRPQLGGELTESFCRTDPAKALVFARTTFLSDNREDLARVSIPTLVIECARDSLAPRHVGAYVHERIDGSELVTLDASGHCPQLSAPEATTEAITAFAGHR